MGFQYFDVNCGVFAIENRFDFEMAFGIANLYWVVAHLIVEIEFGEVVDFVGYIVHPSWKLDWEKRRVGYHKIFLNFDFTIKSVTDVMILDV